jgi:hypothetical protein
VKLKLVLLHAGGFVHLCSAAAAVNMPPSVLVSRQLAARISQVLRGTLTTSRAGVLIVESNGEP